MKQDAWYNITDPDKIDSPALVIYPSRMKENIRLITSRIDNPLRLRPHVKTHKTREATLMMMEAGIRKFKCATIAEAEMLGMCTVPDVLLAYQPAGPKLARFISVIKQFPLTGYSCLIDNKEAARAIAEEAGKEGISIPVYIDLNVGMNRTGISSGEEAFDLYEWCAVTEGIEPVGLHFYDGHIRDKDVEKRRVACNGILAFIGELRERLIKAGYDRPVVIGGGSPSFPIYAGSEDIECSPGTFIYWDAGYRESLPEQSFLVAALVITRVISLIDDRKICLDMGYKAIASENPLDRRARFLNAPDYKLVSQSEEHLVVEAPAPHAHRVGELFYALPEHICPTCALYESAAVIEDGRYKESWKIIARDRKITI